jgi:predicted NBD/HSP70 family sugar kinase
MTEAKAVPSLLRTLNERTVFDAIRADAPISRAEVARRTGISKPTVSLALRALEEAGLVRETGPAPGTPHYGAVYYEAELEAALVLAVDLGARFVRAAVGDLDGQAKARQDVPTPRAIEETIAAIASLRSALTERAPARAVVGVPGVVSAAGGPIALAGDVPGLRDVDVQAELEAALGIPVMLENDVNLAAVGAHASGAARGVDDFVFLSVGTGLGAAVVLGGRLQCGRNGAAGEIDAIRAGRPDEIDPCADALCAYAGGGDLPSIFAAARAGDADALKVVKEAARRIALHILPLSASLDVPLVILGGGVGANGDLLLEPIRGFLVEWLAFPPRVTTSSLGDAAVLTGALATGSAAALEDLFADRSSASRRHP